MLLFQDGNIFFNDSFYHRFVPIVFPRVFFFFLNKAATNQKIIALNLAGLNFQLVSQFLLIRFIRKCNESNDFLVKLRKGSIVFFRSLDHIRRQV